MMQQQPAAAAAAAWSSSGVAGAPATPALPKSFPAQVLLSRVGSHASEAPWSFYLPAELRELLRAPRPASPQQLGAGAGSLGAIDVTGRVWALSQEVHGCRWVQQAFDAASGDEERARLAEELRGHVLAASKCPHANHVLQKVVQTVRPESLQFVIEELMAVPAHQWARHKYGCRVAQRLLERCPLSSVGELVESIVLDVGEFSRHPYGNYVAQRVLERGSPEDRARIARTICGELAGFCCDPHACAVVGAALVAPEPEVREGVAKRLLQEPGLLSLMAYTRHGSASIRAALDTLEAKGRRRVVHVLSRELEALKASRHGQDLVDYMLSVV